MRSTATDLTENTPQTKVAGENNFCTRSEGCGRLCPLQDGAEIGFNEESEPLALVGTNDVPCDSLLVIILPLIPIS